MHFNSVAIIGRYQDSGLDAPVRALAETIQRAGCQVIIEADTARYAGITDMTTCSYDEIGVSADLAVIMGGDGTMIGAARKLANYTVPLIGINHGRLGFITDIPLKNAHEAVTSVIQGHYTLEERSLLEGRIVRGEEILYSGIALNDIVINRAGRGGLIELSVELDGNFMHRQRADGVVISTPTGSTAYALAANGPILYPTMDALLLVPVAPQTLSNRPVVVPGSSILSLTITTLGRVQTGANVHFDMQTLSDCQPGDRIDIRRAQNTVRFIHPEGYSFFSTLRQKLGWNRFPADENE